MIKIALTKFPVISSNGNEYKVDIFQGTWGYHVEVFVEYEKSVFGFKRTKFKSVSGGLLDGYYAGSEWNYNFVEMAKHAVREYENRLRKRNEKNKTIVDQIDRFEKWGGVIEG